MPFKKWLNSPLWCNSNSQKIMELLNYLDILNVDAGDWSMIKTDWNSEKNALMIIWLIWVNKLLKERNIILLSHMIKLVKLWFWLLTEKLFIMTNTQWNSYVLKKSILVTILSLNLNIWLVKFSILTFSIKLFQILN
jgi:hypothetical protein